MKPKKKPAVSTKKASKSHSHKPQFLINKTIATTKEKTHNTLQEPLDIKEVRTQIRTPRQRSGRISYKQKLQQCKLSPFSSPRKSTISPLCKKIVSPQTKEAKNTYKNKQKLHAQPQISEKKINQQQKKQSKEKQKLAKQQNNLSYQKFILKKLGQKKITQLSQESEVSLSKINKVNMNIRVYKENEDKILKSKYLRIRQLKQKIEKKYKRELTSLKKFELNFFCSIVLIQRLWRQRKIKNFINAFISPRSNPNCNITKQIHRQNNNSKLETTVTSQEHTSELIKKYHNFSSILQKKQEVSEKECKQVQIQRSSKPINRINLNDLQLSEELSPQRQKKIVRFVECLREINFVKSPLPQKKLSRINVFNLQQSLSQKCLMQTFYSKIFKNQPTKINNFQVFNSKKEQKQLQRSIELIKSIQIPKKIETLEQQHSFQQQKQSLEKIKLKVQTAQAGVGTQQIQKGQNRIEIKSIYQINQLSQQIIFTLLKEFSEEFHDFTSKMTLRKKKKNTLPGLQVTSQIIKQYLSGLTDFMMQNYQRLVIRRYSLIDPLSFLKIHHQYSDQDQDFQEEDDEINMPIMPNTLFYEYQLIYQAQKFRIRQEDKKFSNFLQSLIKIHNLLLSNCLSEILEKKKIDRVVLPWDNKLNIHRYKNKTISKNLFQDQLSQIIDSLADNAFMKLGHFQKRLDDVTEQKKFLRSLSKEYKQEGNQWSTQYEYLELRLDLSKHIENIVLDQVIQEFLIFF